MEYTKEELEAIGTALRVAIPFMKHTVDRAAMLDLITKTELLIEKFFCSIEVALKSSIK